MKSLLLSMAILGTMSLSAQTIEKQVISSTGGTYSAGTVKITSTIGEAVVKSFTAGTIKLTQGYHQGGTPPVSIQEIIVTANYKLYPNPTTDIAKLEITTLNLDANANIKMYSSVGKLILNQEVKLISGEKSTVTLNLESLSKGTYIIKILDSKSTLSKSLFLVKQ